MLNRRLRMLSLAAALAVCFTAPASANQLWAGALAVSAYAAMIEQAMEFGTWLGTTLAA